MTSGSDNDESLNNNNNSPTTNKNTATRKPTRKSRIPPFNNALSEDEEVVKKFVTTVESKIEQHQFQNELTSKEKAIIRDVVFYPGFFIGSCFALGSFAFMRKAPIYLVNKIEQHRFEYIHKNVKHITNKTDKPEPFKEGSFVKVLGTFFDATLATIFGFVGWSISVNKEKAFNKLSEIPLMEGKSTISTALCHDFISIYKEHNEKSPQFWKEQKDESTLAISKFVHNCQKRHLYQKKIGREMGYTSLTSDEDTIEDIDLPSAVPDGILEDVDHLDDWAALEDFDEDEFDEDNNGRQK